MRHCIKIAYREYLRADDERKKRGQPGFKCRENLWRLSLVKANRFMAVIKPRVDLVISIYSFQTIGLLIMRLFKIIENITPEKRLEINVVQ